MEKHQLFERGFFSSKISLNSLETKNPFHKVKYFSAGLFQIASKLLVV
jgi:hypothetical protein